VVKLYDQNTARQREAIASYNSYKTFEEKRSAKREALEEALAYVRQGDTIIVHCMDRFARSVIDLHNIIETLKAKKIEIHFIKENIKIDPSKKDDPFQTFQIQILSSVPEIERNIIKERQTEGIAAAKGEAKMAYISTEEVKAIRQQPKNTLGKRFKRSVSHESMDQPATQQSIRQTSKAF